MCSDNLPGAVDQQERPDDESGILRDFTPGFKEDSLLKMIKSDLHGDMQAVLRKGKTPQTRCKCALCNKMNGPKVAKFLVG